MKHDVHHSYVSEYRHSKKETNLTFNYCSTDTFIARRQLSNNLNIKALFNDFLTVIVKRSQALKLKLHQPIINLVSSVREAASPSALDFPSVD